MSDAIKAYQFISDNVSSWTETLRTLEVKIKEREDHVSRVPVPARALKKSGSTESIRPASAENGATLEVLSAPQAPDLAKPLDFQHLLLQARRRTGSIASQESVPAKFRTRSMIIVYYDSEIQKTFEQIVRHIGTARNQLRRARTTLQMTALVNGRDCPSGIRSTTSLPVYRTTRAAPQTDDASTTSTGRNTSLASVDAALELAQSYCERGAHQFLREGDSEAEILGAQESFEQAKRIADQELAQAATQPEADSTTTTEAGESRKERLGPHLQGFLQNGRLDIDTDAGNGDEFDDPMMRLARHRPRPNGPALSVPA